VTYVSWTSRGVAGTASYLPGHFGLTAVPFDPPPVVVDQLAGDDYLGLIPERVG
jgi:hypothetical protein